MKYPEIRFKHSWLLIGAIYDDIKLAYEKPNDELYKLSDGFIAESLERYGKAWRPYERKIIHGMCDILGLEFRQNIIDIYTAPFYHSFSDPMFIATKYDDKRIIEVLTHEILHRLLTDNRQTKFETNWLIEWKQLFGDKHSKNTLIHIPVHAMIQALFDDVLKEPERAERDKQLNANYPDYHAAWQYVEKVGYQHIVDQLRASYVGLHERQRI